MAELDARGGEVRVGTAVFRTPGVVGSLTEIPDTTVGQLRTGDDRAPTVLDVALANEGAEFDRAYEFGDVAPDLLLGPDDGIAAIEVEVEALGAGWEQVALLVDDSGAVSWHFPDDGPAGPAGAGAAVRGGGDTRTFTIPLDLRPVPGGAAAQPLRGIAGAIGVKILQFVAFRTVEKVAGLAAEAALGAWERRFRPYRMRSFAPDTFADVHGPAIVGDRWGDLSRTHGRALLMVHGTFSRAHSAFGGLPVDVVRELHQRYDGRVFAFDHPTMTDGPDANIAEFVRSMPDGQTLDLDVIGHSRGGLVARVLAERQSEISLGSRRIAVRRLVFVATPNAGTALAEPAHLVKLIDRFTTLMTLIPDNGVTDILSVVVNLVRHIASGAVGALDGLTAMRPGGSFLTRLNSGPVLGSDAEYYAIGSDYDAAGGPFARARDAIVDRIFEGSANDLVVPTVGVFDLGALGRLPVVDRFEFTGSDAVGHTAFFDRPNVHARLREWLSAAI